MTTIKNKGTLLTDIDFTKLNRNWERKATKNELGVAEQIHAMLTERGLSCTYAGGKKSKGHGFWVYNPLIEKNYGYLNIIECDVLLITIDIDNC